ncbi:alpha/beta hydrolase [Rouxiella sp. Mn2063]|uniref:alpha/beta hydrolase n=1 Tax=Rouxiella sp. Mn2063 TaxID=3395262 RepID=UPI003BC9BB49
MRSLKTLIGLEDVAADVRPVVQACRQAGIAMENLTPEEARQVYSATCAEHTLERSNEVMVTEMIAELDELPIKFRAYCHHEVAAEVTPLVYFIHGGGWVIGNLDTHDSLCAEIARQTKCRVIAADYRLAPEFPFPIALEDCHAALNYLIAQSVNLNIDPQKIILAGDSAGGNMATVLANIVPRTNAPCHLLGQVLFYPVTDLTAHSAGYEKITQGFSLTSHTMKWFRDHYVGIGIDLRDERLSPLYHIHEQQLPMCIITTGLDPLSDEGIEYAAQSALAGNYVEHYHFPQQIHGVLTYAKSVKTARDMLALAANFITRVVYP